MDLKKWWNGPQEDQPKEATSQVNSQVGPQVGPTVLIPAPQWLGGGNATTTYLDQEKHQVWSKFITDKVNELSDAPYRQVSAMVAAMGPATPAQTAYNTAFAGVAATGVTKDQLIASVQKALDALKQNGTEFHQQKEAQRLQQVTSVREQVATKQQQIEKLQQEMSVLNQQASEAEIKISTSILGYDTYQGQALARIGNDLQSITNFIQG